MLQLRNYIFIVLSVFVLLMFTACFDNNKKNTVVDANPTVENTVIDDNATVDDNTTDVIKKPIFLKSLILSTNESIIRVPKSTKINLLALYSDNTTSDLTYNAIYNISDTKIFGINANNIKQLAQ